MYNPFNKLGEKKLGGYAYDFFLKRGGYAYFLKRGGYFLCRMVLFDRDDAIFVCAGWSSLIETMPYSIRIEYVK